MVDLDLVELRMVEQVNGRGAGRGRKVDARRRGRKLRVSMACTER